MRLLPTIRLLLLVPAWLTPTSASADAVRDEYRQRFRAIEVSDIKGHWELAKWCREKGEWQLVAQQCRHILRYEENHRQAKLLLDLARIQLGKAGPSEKGGQPKPGGSGGGADCGDLPRVLTDAEVQRIRRVELLLDAPERLTVKIDRDALRGFFATVEHRDDFPYGKRTFFRLRPVEQAQLMLEYGREKFGDKVTIRRDPERMRTFEREVLPIVLRGCATAECHGGGAAGCLRLRGGRSQGTNSVYANFLVLHEYGVDGRRLIDRNSPDRSLVLTYGLPRGFGDDAKPFNHPTDIATIFEDERDADYQAVLNWLRSLDLSRPDYDIDLSKP